MKQTGIYSAAVVFFFTGLLCIAQGVTLIFHSLGFEQGRGLLYQRGSLWVLLCGLLLFWLLCYGVVALVRLQAGARWAFFGMSLFLLFRFLTAAGTSSTSSARQRIFGLLLFLPLAIACIYLWRCSARPRGIKSDE